VIFYLGLLVERQLEVRLLVEEAVEALVG
jgi:hypothetical protein